MHWHFPASSYSSKKLAYQLLFDRLFDDNVEDDSNNSYIKASEFTNNRTIAGLVTDDNYHTDKRPESCRTLTIYYNNNDNNNNYSKKR